MADGQTVIRSRSVNISTSEFRRALGHLPTAVTVVTAFADDGLKGMSANSVTSVSLDPPLILVCPARTSTTWPKIRATGKFCVNVMAHHHVEACKRFALRGADRFAGVDWHERDGGPAFDDAVAWIDCELQDEHDAGDHTIAIGRVLSIEASTEARPLVFFRGLYGGFVGPAGSR
jgi:flavin reductase (DIM6/NTAB) family NADH-FMN oxidoreductase RutF